MTAVTSHLLAELVSQGHATRLVPSLSEVSVVLPGSLISLAQGPGHLLVSS